MGPDAYSPETGLLHKACRVSERADTGLEAEAPVLETTICVATVDQPTAGEAWEPACRRAAVRRGCHRRHARSYGSCIRPAICRTATGLVWMTTLASVMPHTCVCPQGVGRRSAGLLRDWCGYHSGIGHAVYLRLPAGRRRELARDPARSRSGRVNGCSGCSCSQHQPAKRRLPGNRPIGYPGRHGRQRQSPHTVFHPCPGTSSA